MECSCYTLNDLLKLCEEFQRLDVEGMDRMRSNDRTGAIQALLKLHLLLNNIEKSGTPIGKSVDNAVLLNQKSISIFNKSSRTTCTNPLINHFHLLIVD